MTLTVKQLEMRRTGISASDVSSILGLNPYRKPIDVWVDKTNTEPFEEQEETEQQALGHVFEKYLSDYYCKKAPPGVRRRVYEPKQTLQHPHIEWAFATPDRFLFEVPSATRLPLGLKALATTGKASRLLEIKLVGPFAIKNWIADIYDTDEEMEESDRIPMYVFCQCQWQMLVTGYRRVDVVAMLGGTKLRIFEIPYDKEFVDNALTICEDFRKNFILPKIEPRPDGSNQYREYLSQKYPCNLDKNMIEATEAAHSLAIDYSQLGVAEKEIKTKREKLSQMLKDIIGVNDGIKGDWGTVTWRLGRGRVDYKKLVSDFNLKDSDLDKYRNPSRTFRANVKDRG